MSGKLQRSPLCLFSSYLGKQDIARVVRVQSKVLPTFGCAYDEIIMGGPQGGCIQDLCDAVGDIDSHNSRCVLRVQKHKKSNTVVEIRAHS